MSANSGITASKAIADLCGDPLIAEEVSEKLKASKMRDYIEYIYAIAHNVAQKAREGKEVDVLDILTRIEFFAKEAKDCPLLNCEVGTAEEQAERYGRYCDQFTRGRMHCETCPCCGKISFGRCEFAWAQMPYEAQEDKEGK